MKDRRLGRAESVMSKAGTSKVVAPSVSIKDRGVGTREQVLNVPIACWHMGPVCLVACRRQLCGFLHCFYGCDGGEKLNEDL
jgi:hypothetical protein